MQTLIGFTVKQARKEHTEQIKQLLQKAHLPIIDLQDELPDFLIAIYEGQLVGCIGLQAAGNNALLRSFAVDEAFRSRGIGKILYEAIIKLAGDKFISYVFLITTTAEKYFEKQGFEKISRSDAPASIAQTQQFSSICASSGIVMRKEI